MFLLSSLDPRVAAGSMGPAGTIPHTPISGLPVYHVQRPTAGLPPINVPKATPVRKVASIYSPSYSIATPRAYRPGASGANVVNPRE